MHKLMHRQLLAAFNAFQANLQTAACKRRAATFWVSRTLAAAFLTYRYALC